MPDTDTAGSDSQDTATTDDHDDDAGTNDDDASGALRALAAERKARKAAESARKQLEARLSKIEDDNRSESEKALERARQEAAEAASKEATAKANARIVRAEVRAAAAGKLADPALAMRLLDLDEFEVDDEGNVDAKAVSKAIDGLIRQYPALASDSRSVTGNGDGGARGRVSGGDMNSFLARAIRDRKG